MTDTLTPDETELAALRARRAEVEARRAHNAEQAAARAQLDAERHALADEEAIARFEDELGPVDKLIAVVRTDLGTVILRRAKPPAYKRFNEQITREGAKPFELSEQLVVACLLYPSREVFATMIEAQPFITIRCASAISTLAGVRTQEVVGK